MTGSDHLMESFNWKFKSISVWCTSYKFGQCDSMGHADFTLTISVVEILLQNNEYWEKHWGKLPPTAFKSPKLLVSESGQK